MSILIVFVLDAAAIAVLFRTLSGVKPTAAGKYPKSLIDPGFFITGEGTAFFARTPATGGCLSPLAATTYASLWGTSMLALAAGPDLFALKPEDFTLPVVLSVLYLGVLGTSVAFVWYYQAVQRLGAARTVIFNNLVPVFGATLGVLLLGEPLLPSMLLGGAIAVAGVMLVTKS